MSDLAETKFSSFTLMVLTIALSLGTFIQVLDTSIANVAIPYISGDLGVSTVEGTWVITSFAVSNAVMLPLSGWLGRRFGDIRVFIWSTTLFSIASWLCGLSWNLPALIFFRVLQGAAGGPLIPLSQSLLLRSYPSSGKGTALGIWSIVVIVAPILGPILGGWLTYDYGWRWIFYINIPLGILSAYLTYDIIGKTEEKKERLPIDVVGFILLVIAVGALQVMFDKGNQWDWFKSPFIIQLAIVSFLGFFFFIPWNYYSTDPVVDFSCFGYRNFTIGTILISSGYMLFFASVVLTPLWLQTQQGYTPIWAGIAIAPVGIIPLLVSVPLGKYMHKIDLRWLITGSFFFNGVTFFGFTYFYTQVSIDWIIYFRLFQGIGLSLLFIPLVALALDPIPSQRLTSASGVFNFIRLLAGGGAGTSLSVTLWDNWHQYYHSRLAEWATLYRSETHEYLNLLHGYGFKGLSADAYMDTIVNQEAYMLSLNDIFWGGGWVFFLLIPLIWSANRPTKKAQGAASAAH